MSIKSIFMSIVVIGGGFLAGAVKYLLHLNRELKDKIKVKAHTIKVNREQDRIKTEQAKKREEELNEIQSDTYNPRDSFGRFDK